MAKNSQNIKSRFSFISLNLLTKTKFLPSFILWCFISIALVSCQKDDLETYKSLDRLNWSAPPGRLRPAPAVPGSWRIIKGITPL